MIENIRFRFVSVLALTATLVLPAAPARAEDPPHGDVAAALERAETLVMNGDSRNGCKEYLRASDLSQGKSVPGWIGLTDCQKELGNFDKAVEMARKARSVAATPQERTDASRALACALLVKPDAQANAEAAALLKEGMASPGGSRLQSAYFQALLELNRDSEAAEFRHSLGTKDTFESVPCRVVDQKQADVLNERLHAIDPELDVVPIGAKVTRPEIISQVSPEVTAQARRHPGFSGQVVVEAIIDRQGRVPNVRVLKGQPYGLSESAAASVKQWRFKPATLNGKPVKIYYVVTISFQITNH